VSAGMEYKPPADLYDILVSNTGMASSPAKMTVTVILISNVYFFSCIYFFKKTQRVENCSNNKTPRWWF
jgi:hypothetical protein